MRIRTAGDACALCLGTDCALRESHIIPSFLVNMARDGEGGKIMALTGEPFRYKFVGDYCYERLLCDTCEGLLEREYETPFKAFWYESGGCPTPGGDNELKWVEGIDYARFKLFHLSILWRASVSRRPEFNAVRLGPHEETIRRMVYTADPGPAGRYPLLGEISSLDGESVHAALMPPQPSRWDARTVYTALYAGCIWRIMVSSFEETAYVRAALSTNGRMPMMTVQLTKIEPLAAFMEKAVLAVREGQVPRPPTQRKVRKQREEEK